MRSTIRISLSAFLLAAMVLACGGTAATPTQDPVNAINTGIAGTQQAQALAQATVNSTVLTAMPATPTPGPTVEYVTLTEEQLTALIDESVTEAAASTEQTTAAVTTTTSDDVLTAEEMAYLYDYYTYADYYVEYAEELLSVYYDLYGDLAYEMIVEMNAIESALAAMNDTLVLIAASLDEINSGLQQGAAATQEAIAQLESAAQTAQTNAQTLQAEVQDIKSVLQADQQGRLDQIAQIQPDAVPTDRLTSLQTAFQFLDAANLAMGDEKLSRDELMNMAQLGVNARSGFQSFGGADALGGVDLGQFSGRFDEITGQFARGQIPQARGGLSQFESALGNRPAGMPDIPGGGGGPDLPNPRR